MKTLARGLAASLPPADVVLDLDPDEAARGLPGVAWCPTPRALARLRAAGARVPLAPPVEVLRRVNDRAFALEIASLPDARICASLEEALSVLARPPRSSASGTWLVRRGLGFAGRGSWRVGAMRPSDRAFLAASFARGTVVLEPFVDVSLEVALHGDTEGAIGVITVQEIDSFGQWVASRPARPGEVTVEEQDTLRSALEGVREALRAAGYFGPFGVDALRWRDADGRARFHPVGDLNARYTMGWPVGMGAW